MPRFALGIRARVLLAALLPMTLLAVLFATIFLLGRVDDLYDAHLQKAKAMARQVVSGSEYSLFTGNHETLQRLLDELSREEDVRSVSVIGGDGKTIASAGKPGYENLPEFNGRNSEILNLTAQTLLLAWPIHESQLVVKDIFTDSSLPRSRQLGQLVLELSTARVLGRERNLLLTGILLSLGGLLFGGLLAVNLSRGVIDPIVQVSNMVERIAQGDLSARVGVGGNGYLRRLEEGLNLMAARIASGQQELQRQIAEATAELRVKKEEAEVAMQAITQANNELALHHGGQPGHTLCVQPEWRLIKWNANFEKFCGLTHQQMKHRQMTEFICKKTGNRVKRNKRDFARGASSIEAHFIRHDGEFIPFLCNCVVLKNVSGDVIAFTGTGRTSRSARKPKNPCSWLPWFTKTAARRSWSPTPTTRSLPSIRFRTYDRLHSR